jgi:adenylylsulfate kinase
MGRYTILVMGLPGSGKTTLATALSKVLGASHLNADEIRKQHDDWDFSREGRIRQASRMKERCTITSSHYDVCDFVAALREQREILNPDFIIWMNTVTEGRYEDTNKAFEPPANADIILTNWGYDAHDIARRIWHWIRPTRA